MASSRLALPMPIKYMKTNEKNEKHEIRWCIKFGLGSNWKRQSSCTQQEKTINKIVAKKHADNELNRQNAQEKIVLRKNKMEKKKIHENIELISINSIVINKFNQHNNEERVHAPWKRKHPIFLQRNRRRNVYYYHW